jgi:hypothetical protein
METVRANAPTLQIPSPFPPDATPPAPSPVLTAPPLPSFSSLMPPPPPTRETTDPHGLPPPTPQPPPFSQAAEPAAPQREQSPRGTGPRAAIHERSSRASEQPMSLAEEVAAAAAAAAAAKGSPPARAGEASSPMALVAEMAGSAEAKGRGLDDTHPGYKVKSDSPNIHDTQPGVVLDEEALAHMETEESSQPIVSGLLEEEEPSSAQARMKSGRRQRVSSAGMPALSRAASPGRSGSVRALDAEEPAESSEPKVVSGEADLDVNVDMDADLPARDPRDDTRRTPMPTRPGEPKGRIHRDDPRRTEPVIPAQKKRSWLGVVLTVVLLGVVVGALAMTYPLLKPVVEKLLAPATPAVTKPPSTSPAVPPAEPVDGAVPAPTEAAPGAPSATGEAAPVKPATEPAAVAAEPVPEDTDILVPLTAPPSQPTAKKPPVRTTRKGSRKENDLQKEWGATSRAFFKLTEVQSCESPKVGILCKRFESLQNDVEQAGEAGDKELLGRVKKLRSDLQKAMNAAQ